jgi:hypothetical protein
LSSREGTSWQHILQTLVCYRLIDPGSEWRLHRQWFEQSAMADLLGEDYALVAKNALYRCLDKLLPHKAALFAATAAAASSTGPAATEPARLTASMRAATAALKVRFIPWPPA